VKLQLCCSECDSIVILSGDTRPVEVICHLPVICEESGIPYCYVPSKEVSCSWYLSLSMAILERYI